MLRFTCLLYMFTCLLCKKNMRHPQIFQITIYMPFDMELWNTVYQWQWQYNNRHALWQMVPKVLKELPLWLGTMNNTTSF